MKTILIAFDIDGTLRDNTVQQDNAPKPNEDIRSLLVILAKFKNVKILVWSGGGELYARQIVAHFGLASYVDYYASKVITEEDGWGVEGLHPDFQPDIAIDDIQRCNLGLLNLIVREK